MEKQATLIIAGVIVLALIFAGFESLQKVEAGFTGVKVFLGKVDHTQAYAPGPYWVMPWVEEMINIETRTQLYKTDTEASSSDLQVVRTTVGVNFQPLAVAVPELYNDLGPAYVQRIIEPVVEETVKSVSAKYTAEELIQKRPLVKSEITEQIKAKLFERNITVEEISITEFQFSDSFNKSIEEKVKAEQDALKAENLVKLKEAEAQQTIAEAEGLAEAKRLAGDAEAYALNVVGQALKENPDLLTMEYIQNWNGKLPYFYSGDNGDGPQMLLTVPNNIPDNQP